MTRRFLWIFSVLLMISLLPSPGVRAQESLPPTAEAMSAALNQWRLDVGLSPLQYNQRLEALARVQIEYLMTLPNIPKNLHDGMEGEGPRLRAIWDPYTWPDYGNPERVSLEEITVAQKSVAQGIEWWQNSPIHNAAATNPNYREFGVAALPYEYGTVFVAVLAGRPNVFPAMVHPDGSLLYLTQETYPTVGNEHMAGINEFRLLDDEQNPLTDWEEWTRVRPLDDIEVDAFYVEYGNGETTTLTHVNRNEDIVKLPASVDRTLAGQANENVPEELDTVPITVETVNEQVFALRLESDRQVYINDFSFVALKLEAVSPAAAFTDFAGIPYAAPGACFIFAAEGAPVEEPESCTGPLSLIRIPPDRIFWYDAELERLAGYFVLNQDGVPIADCRNVTQPCAFEVTAYPFVAGQGPIQPVSEQIRLVYDDRTFALINEGGQILDISNIVFEDDDTSFSTVEWETQIVGELPSENCLQLVGTGILSPRKPLACGVRQRWASVQDDEQFWVSGTFAVLVNGAPIAECRTEDGECVFELP